MDHFCKWWPDRNSEAAISGRLSHVLGNALNLLPVSIQDGFNEPFNDIAMACTEVLWTFLIRGKVDGDRISVLLQDRRSIEWACAFLIDVFRSGLSSAPQLCAEVGTRGCVDTLIAGLAQDLTTAIQGKILLLLAGILTVLEGTDNLHDLNEREECFLDTQKLVRTLTEGRFLEKDIDIKHLCAKSTFLIAILARADCHACLAAILKGAGCLEKLIELLAGDVTADLQEAALTTLGEIARHDPDESAYIFDVLATVTSDLLLKIVPFLSQDMGRRCELSAALVGYLARASSCAVMIVKSPSFIQKLVELLAEDVAPGLQEGILTILRDAIAELDYGKDQNAIISGVLTKLTSDLLTKVVAFLCRDLGMRCKLSVSLLGYLGRAPSCAMMLVSSPRCMQKLVGLLAEGVSNDLKRAARKTFDGLMGNSNSKPSSNEFRSSLIFAFDKTYVPRKLALQQIRTSFRKSRIVVLYGDSGTGKSTLAWHSALSFEENAMKKMDQGQSCSLPATCYVHCGREGVVVDIQAQLLRTFSVQHPKQDFEAHGIEESASQSVHRIRTTLENHLRDLDALVILDDVWESELVENIVVPGNRLKYLITTRNADLWPDPNAQSIKIQDVDMDSGRQIVANYAKSEQFQVEADALIEVVQSHPLALATLGMVLQRRHNLNADGWENLRSNISEFMEADQYRSISCGERYPRSVSATLMLTVDDQLLGADALKTLYIISLFQGPRISESMVQSFLKYTQPSALKRFHVNVGVLEAFSLVKIEKRPTEVLHMNILGVVSTEVLVHGAENKGFQSGRQVVINSLRQSFILKQKEEDMNAIKGFLRGDEEFGSPDERSNRDWATILCAISGISRVRNEAQQKMGQYYKWWPNLLMEDADLDSESGISRRMSRILGNALDLLPMSIEERSLNAKHSNDTAKACTEVLWTFLADGKIDGRKLSALLQEPNAMEWACSFLFEIFLSKLASARQLSDAEMGIQHCANALIALLAKGVTTAIEGKVLLILQWIVLSGTMELHGSGDRQECLLDTQKLFNTLTVGGFLVKDMKHRSAMAAGLIAAVARTGCYACTAAIARVETSDWFNKLVELLAKDVAADLQEAALITLCELADRDPASNAIIFGLLERNCSDLLVKVDPLLSQALGRRCELSIALVRYLGGASSCAVTIVENRSCLQNLIILLAEDVTIELQEAALQALCNVVNHDDEENAIIFDVIATVASDLLQRVVPLLSIDLGYRCIYATNLLANLTTAPANRRSVGMFPGCLDRLVKLLAPGVEETIQKDAIFTITSMATCDDGDVRKKLLGIEGLLEAVTRVLDEDVPESISGEAVKALACLSGRDEIEKQICNIRIRPSIRGILYRYWYSENATREAWPAALYDINRALELDSEDGLLWQERGVLWRLMKNYDGALEDLHKALEIKVDNYECLKHRAFVKFLMGNEDGACRDAERAILVTPGSRVDGHSYERGCLGVLPVQFLTYELK